MDNQSQNRLHALTDLAQCVAFAWSLERACAIVCVRNRGTIWRLRKYSSLLAQKGCLVLGCFWFRFLVQKYELWLETGGFQLHQFRLGCARE